MKSVFLALAFFSVSSLARPLIVGSKKFTESVILGELITQVLSHEGMDARHREEIGGTRILWSALVAGDIDIYPDYTGTVVEEILRKPVTGIQAIRDELKKQGIGATQPLGFNNTYSVGMKRSLAKKLGIRKISDLARHPHLKLGWGEEFRRRPDGWPGLKERYKLPHRFVRGFDHDIAYRAIQSGDLDVTDLYSTDAEIAYYDLVTLEDDLKFFPRYEAFFLYRLDRASSTPALKGALEALQGKISESAMVAMNRSAKIDRVSAPEVASRFLRSSLDWSTEHEAPSRNERVLVRTKEHLLLVTISICLGILASIPLGILAEKKPGFGRWILGGVGLIQTVPALALLVVLIRPLNLIGLSGIGDTPALIALFLYSLLPIVRSTHTGLCQIPLALRETASVLDLRFSTRLFKIELPLALPHILSGIKTSAVMNVGFATLGSLVGAGGYGQPILSGIRLDDYGLILEGALPAAALALLVQFSFDAAERALVSPGLR